jgi:uncharacterized protein YukE
MSLLHADPGALRTLADRIGRHAADVRSTAARLDAAVRSAQWRGPAAGAFHWQARSTVGALGSAAGSLEASAAALRRLADAVQALLDDLRRLMRDDVAMAGDVGSIATDLLRHPGRVPGDAVGLLGDAVTTVGDIGGAVADLLGI